jgi:hypothetical protein
MMECVIPKGIDPGLRTITSTSQTSPAVPIEFSVPEGGFIVLRRAMIRIFSDTYPSVHFSNLFSQQSPNRYG